MAGSATRIHLKRAPTGSTICADGPPLPKRTKITVDGKLRLSANFDNEPGVFADLLDSEQSHQCFAQFMELMERDDNQDIATLRKIK